MFDPRLPDALEQPDDIDRLFARLDRAAVPPDLTARVLANTVARPRPASRPAWPWIVAGLAALGLLIAAGYELGASVAASGGLDLVIGLFGDVGLLATAPGDVLAALGEVIPWRLALLAVLSGMLLTWAAGRLVSLVPAGPATRHAA